MLEKEPRKDLTTARNLELLTPIQFRNDFYNETALAVISSDPGQNFLIHDSQRPIMGLEAMWIELYGRNQRAIYASVIKAARAGFNVELHRDWYSDNIADGQFTKLPFSLLNKRENEAHRRWVDDFNKKRLDKLEDEGVKIVPINVPNNLVGKETFLFHGRDHKKIIFIKGPQKMVAWVGGMNLAEEHFRELDFMVKFDDQRIVQVLINEFQRTSENKRKTNAEIRATDDTTILVDTGKEDSLILKQAIQDVDSAEKTVYVSSAFLPSGKFLEALARAKDRGVHIVYITSNPDVAKGLLGIQGKLSDLKNRRKSKIPVMFPEKSLVHAKVLVVDNKSVIIGSHNFIEMPHEELSLRSEDPTLVKNVTAFMQSITGNNLDRKLDADFIIPEK